jgi:hypothetical protein
MSYEPRNNIILVGTKLDLVHRKESHRRKEKNHVLFEEAIELAEKLRLAAVIETSSLVFSNY